MIRIPRKHRQHVIAISTICVVITVIFFAMQPKKVLPQAQPQLMGDRYIQIYSATWGENCNRYIDDALARPLPPKRDEKGNLIEQKLPQRVATDNALDVLNTLCNGKLTCSVTANRTTLGFDPLESCFKELVVSYRCFTLDRLWSTTTRQSDTLQIDCREKKPEDTQPSEGANAQAKPQSQQ